MIIVGLGHMVYLSYGLHVLRGKVRVEIPQEVMVPQKELEES